MLNIAIYDKDNDISDNMYTKLINYCKKYNYSWKIYKHELKDAHRYHIIFIKNIDDLMNTYGIHYKIIYIDQLPEDIDKYITQKRPLLFKKSDNNIIIPKNIHFMWLSKNNTGIPKKYNKNINTYKQYNPDYIIKLWENNEIDTLIKNNLPEFYETFLNITPWISKCDFARFCLIYIMGGIYSDCDFYCNKSLNGLINHKTELYIRETDTALFNGFFASIPKSEFIYGWLERMKQNMNGSNVLFKTGPVGFGIYYNQLTTKPALTETYYVLPYKYLSNIMENVDKIDENYVYTLWHEGCGWNKDNGNIKMIILSVLILLIMLYIVLCI